MVNMMTGLNYSICLLHQSTCRDIISVIIKRNLVNGNFHREQSSAANGYLIIWADNDTTEAGLHANFKLSSEGEDALISNPEKTIIDKVTFPAQSLELSYSRVPNGTGEFKWQAPTFNRSNNTKYTFSINSLSQSSFKLINTGSIINSCLKQHQTAFGN